MYIKKDRMRELSCVHDVQHSVFTTNIVNNLQCDVLRLSENFMQIEDQLV